MAYKLLISPRSLFYRALGHRAALIDLAFFGDSCHYTCVKKCAEASDDGMALWFQSFLKDKSSKKFD